MAITIIRNLPTNGQVALVLIERDGKHYVASQVNNMFANETLIFPADENGNVTRYLEVFGLRNTSAADTILAFLEVPERDWDWMLEND